MKFNGSHERIRISGREKMFPRVNSLAITANLDSRENTMDEQNVSKHGTSKVNLDSKYRNITTNTNA